MEQIINLVRAVVMTKAKERSIKRVVFFRMFSLDSKQSLRH
jgi:hypothetical protein